METTKEKRERKSKSGKHANMAPAERWLSVLGGSALSYLAVKKRKSLGRMALTTAGGLLLFRGTTGRCPVYNALGISTAGEHAGITIEKTVVIGRPREEVYSYWHDFSNLPNFMSHLESVEVLDDRMSRWVAKTPGGMHLTWNAETTKDIPNEKIKWRSLPGSDFGNKGSVSFKPGPNGNDTELKFKMTYYPPGGAAAVAVSELVNIITAQEIEKNLNQFKEMMESSQERLAATA
jgi:uncharacterized membrane protein